MKGRRPLFSPKDQRRVGGELDILVCSVGCIDWLIDWLVQDWLIDWLVQDWLIDWLVWRKRITYEAFMLVTFFCCTFCWHSYEWHRLYRRKVWEKSRFIEHWLFGSMVASASTAQAAAPKTGRFFVLPVYPFLLWRFGFFILAVPLVLPGAISQFGQHGTAGATLRPADRPHVLHSGHLFASLLAVWCWDW